MNEAFVKNAIQSEETRAMIVKYYNDVVDDEKQQYVRENRSRALKLGYQKQFRKLQHNLRQDNLDKEEASSADLSNEET